MVPLCPYALMPRRGIVGIVGIVGIRYNPSYAKKKAQEGGRTPLLVTFVVLFFSCAFLFLRIQNNNKKKLFSTYAQKAQ